MEFWQIAAFGIAATVLCVLLQQYRPEFAAMAAVLCGALLLIEIMEQMVPVFTVLNEMIERTGVSPHYLRAVLKALGICYIAQLACDTCRDAGQTTIASKIELGAKVAVVVLSLPMFLDVAEAAFGLLQ